MIRRRGHAVNAAANACRPEESGFAQRRLQPQPALLRTGVRMNHESYVLRDLHPVGVIEHVAHRNEWSFERDGDDELSIEVAGVWADYHVSFSWLEDVEALHLLCAFDLKVPKRRMQEMIRLIAMVNEQLLLGHFDLWEREGAVMYRQALLLSGRRADGRQVERC